MFQKFNVKQNMSFLQLIKSYYYCVKDNQKIFNRYRKMFKNYLQVIFKVKQKKYPIKCKLRKGGSLIINKHFEIINFVMANHYGISFDKETDQFSGLSTNSSDEIILYGGEGAGDAEIFLENHYNFLPVTDKVVVDIGANIGDSAIYFVLHGAKKVVGLELHPRIFEIAKKNVQTNHCSNKIQILLAGCSFESGFLKIDPKNELGIRTRLVPSKNGYNVQLMTLEQIMDMNDMDPAVLKIDCEGCEYDVILTSSKNILRKFSHLIIEYHYGYKNLKDKLEKCGFKVSITEPRYTLDTKMYLGYLYAIRN